MEHYFPDELLAHIVSFVESVPIDTRLAFGVLPKQLIIDEKMKYKLNDMYSRRKVLYKERCEREKTNEQCHLFFEFIHIKIGSKDFCIDYRDYNGSMGYRIIKLPSRLYFAVSIDEAVDFPCNRYYVSGPYCIHTGLLLNTV
jgi:hypothetical protein